MIITVPPELESALSAQAQQRGISPETLVVDVLRRQLFPVASPVPTDEWERRLFEAAVDCGVSVPDSALSSDGLYESHPVRPLNEVMDHIGNCAKEAGLTPEILDSLLGDE